MMYSNHKSSANANVSVDGNLAISLSQYAGYEDYDNDSSMSNHENGQFEDLNKELSNIKDENIIPFDFYRENREKIMAKRKERLSVFKLPSYTRARVMNGVLGFRECSNLLKIADETGTVITLISNSKVGTTKSISSLIMLGLNEGMSVTVKLDGGDIHKAYLMVKDVLDGITVERSY